VKGIAMQTWIVCRPGIAMLWRDRTFQFFILWILFCFAQCPLGFGAAQYNLLHGFAGAPSDGATPYYAKVIADGSTLYGMTLNGGASNTGTLFKIDTSGSGYHVLHSFEGRNIVNIYRLMAHIVRGKIANV
jgi:uncharacterized repeat protein (TIGR03803 family)